jgi:ABC-type uncharacterized transport system permease subunit
MPHDLPTSEIRLLVALALAALAAASPLMFLAGEGRRKAQGVAAATLLSTGLGLSLAALALRLTRGHLPTGSSFDTFTTFAVLAGAAAVYFRAIGILPAAGKLLIPAAAFCALLAAAFSGQANRDFAGDLWNVAHVVSAVGAAVCFAASAGGGILYLQKHAGLRRKEMAVFGRQMPSLERLDRFVRHALPVGFVFVTAAIATGLLGAFQPQRAEFFRAWWTHPKVLVAGIAWVAYALALHSVSARRCRMRTAAVLAIAGFVLLAGVMVGSMLMPRAW